jgi:hypothetical protein
MVPDMSGQFAIVFEKLAEFEHEDQDASLAFATIRADVAESDDIAELQRLCAALSDRPVRYYTGT